MNENTLGLILELIKLGTGIVKDVSLSRIHRDASGNIVQLSVGVILEATDARNAATLATIVAANAQPMKGVL